MVVALLLAYPVACILYSRIPDQIPENLPRQIWADTRIGASIELIENKLETEGWVVARPDWHPQSRLTAMPSFQKGVSEVMSGFARLRADLVDPGQGADGDLLLAANLLAEADTEFAEDQIFAAIQALRRFDGLKARRVLDDTPQIDLLAREAGLFTAVLESCYADLRNIAENGSRAFIDQTRIAVYYRTKGRLFAVGVLLNAQPDDMIASAQSRSLIANSQSSLREAYKPSPILISNPVPSGFSLFGSDYLQLMYLVSEAQADMEKLADLLSDKPAPRAVSLVERS
ncbi:MAG: hypothetical protein CMK07_09200 [Ponticaulis sp.]|nr:hypothetical protein [Ponticaulis sp.]